MQGNIKRDKRELILLIGSNLNNPQLQLESVVNHLVLSFGELQAKSMIYESLAWGKTDQPNFLNQVLVFETDLLPTTVILKTQEVERKMGRVKKEKWDARIIDVDILFYGDLILETEKLSIPHPYIGQRKFTLVPLVEVIPNYVHPVYGVTMNQLLNDLSDNSPVKPVHV